MAFGVGVGWEWLLVIGAEKLWVGGGLHGGESAIVLVDRNVLVSNRRRDCCVLRELSRRLRVLLGEGSVAGHVETHMPRVEIHINLEIKRIHAIRLPLRILRPIDHIYIYLTSYQANQHQSTHFFPSSYSLSSSSFNLAISLLISSRIMRFSLIFSCSKFFSCFRCLYIISKLSLS